MHRNVTVNKKKQRQKWQDCVDEFVDYNGVRPQNIDMKLQQSVETNNLIRVSPFIRRGMNSVKTGSIGHIGFPQEKIAKWVFSLSLVALQPFNIVDFMVKLFAKIKE